MEDDKLKDLFQDFDPKLSSSCQFMSRLQKSMEAVEIVRRHNHALKKRNKLAVAIAAGCGFAAGVLFMSLIPLVSDWISTFGISLSHIRINSLTVDYSLVAWGLLAVACGITSLNAYEIALAWLTPKGNLS